MLFSVCDLDHDGGQDMTYMSLAELYALGYLFLMSSLF